MYQKNLWAFALLMVAATATMSGTVNSSPFFTIVLSNAVEVNAGFEHTCAVLNTGSVKCWGHNNYGQLGNGTTVDSTTPVAVSGITTAVSVVAGVAHTCAALSNGTVKCWGYNYNGRLGNGTDINSSTPVTVSGISNAVSVIAGNDFSCALLSGGSLLSNVKCWGGNGYGQLGDGTKTTSLIPVRVSRFNTATKILVSAVSISASSHNTCAALSDGTVTCWGSNSYGQLGDGTTTSSSTPVSGSGISNAESVITGDYYSCAILNTGEIECWGGNANGRLGDGTDTDSLVPVSVSGVSTAESTSTGNFGSHLCAVLSSGEIKCWGYNSYGQLGDGTTTSSCDEGEYYYDADGNLCEGTETITYDSYGGSHTSTTYSEDCSNIVCAGPSTVSGISTAESVSSGDVHSCAALSSGKVKCWGRNNYGQLGNGTTTDSSTPVVVKN